MNVSMIGLAQSRYNAPLRASSPEPATVSRQDQVEVSDGSGQPRPLWRDVERLGLWASVEALGNSPLKAAFSAQGLADLTALLSQFEAKGFTFGACSQPNDANTYGTTQLPRESVEGRLVEDGAYNIGWLTMSSPLPAGEPPPQPSWKWSLREDKPKPRLDNVKTWSFQDLHDLEAIELTGDLSALEKPELAASLKQLEDKGAQFRILRNPGREGYSVNEDLKYDHHRSVGTYGAYRALLRDERDRSQLWVRDPHSEGMYPLRDEKDLAVARFFLLGETHPELDQDPVATQLRDLARLGFQFHLPKEHAPIGALGAYWLRHDSNWVVMGVSLRGRIARTDYEFPHQSAQPLALEPAQVELAAYRENRLLPEVAAGHMTEEESDFYLHGLARESGQDLDSKMATMGRLREFERTLLREGSEPDVTHAGVVAFLRLSEARARAQRLDDMLPEFMALRQRGIKPDVAAKAMQFFREKLRPNSLDEADYAEQRARVLDVSDFASSFDDALKALPVLQIPVAEPFEERLATLRILHGKNQGAAGDSFLDSRSAMDEAIADYQALLGSPHAAQTLEHAAAYLGALHQTLVPVLMEKHPDDPLSLETKSKKLAFEVSRETYRFLQRGLERGSFLSREPEAVLGAFRQEFALTHDVELSRSLLVPAGRVRESFAERQALARRLEAESPEGFRSDYTTLLRSHRPTQALAEEADVLQALHRSLDAQEGADKARQAFQALQESLDGPWTGRPLRDAGEEFLKNYTLRESLDEALKSLETPPAQGGLVSGVEVRGGQVIIGGVRVRVKARP
ncbi:MAG: hypothetical protein AB1758_11990 [Candidatus Eremiobacterota bacterium]